MVPLIKDTYLLGNQISHNPQGSVYLGVNILTGDEIILKKQTLSSPFAKGLKEEFDIISSLPPHPNIITAIERVETQTEIFLITMSAGSMNLFQYLTRFGKFTEQSGLDLIYPICLGVQHLHTNLIIHGDLKPENIILDSKLKPCICDFGGSFPVMTRMAPKYVSIPYSAPEILDQSLKNGPAVDVWSLGVLLHVVLSAKQPWTEEEWKEKDLKYYPDPCFSDSITHLLRRTLKVKVKHRITLTELLEFIQQLQPLLSSSKDGFPIMRVARAVSESGVNKKSWILSRLRGTKKKSKLGLSSEIPDLSTLSQSVS